MRFYQCFKTKEERTEWERERKSKNDNFVVCMHKTARQLEKEMYMPKGELKDFEYATVYTYREEL